MWVYSYLKKFNFKKKKNQPEKSQTKALAKSCHRLHRPLSISSNHRDQNTCSCSSPLPANMATKTLYWKHQETFAGAKIGSNRKEQQGKEDMRATRQQCWETLILSLWSSRSGKLVTCTGVVISKNSSEILSKHTLESTVCKKLHFTCLLPPKGDSIFLKPVKMMRNVMVRHEHSQRGWARRTRLKALSATWWLCGLRHAT